MEPQDDLKLKNRVVGDIPIILRYIEYEVSFIWITYCNEESLDLFKDEINQYNQWIKILEMGNASPCSYKDPDEATKLKISHNLKYHFFFIPEEEYPKKWDMSFDIIDPDSEEYEEYINKYDKDINFSLASTLFDILVRPYDPYNPALGYQILPITNELFKDQFLYGPESFEYQKAKDEFENMK